jgi:Zn finger protein HypA/HybF involved in hydrogenase expression
MTDCRHANLLVITENSDRLRCRYCHLTLKSEELRDGCCPECLEVTDRKRNDFDKIETEQKKVQYRCEDCGAMLTPACA